MKVEFLTFCQYATELHQDNFLSKEDLDRVNNSIRAKSIGFVQDMCALAGDVRLGLSTGSFRLSEHTNKVFERPRRSLLPRFLGGAMNKVFDRRTGRLKDDYCHLSAAKILMFLDALKRIDPPGSHVPLLKEKVWTNLRSNFGDSERVRLEVQRNILEDDRFAWVFSRARDIFRDTLSKVNMDDLPIGSGPGKNLDRHEACTSGDWTMPNNHPCGEASARIGREVQRYFNRQPFTPKRKRKPVYRLKGRVLGVPNGFMKCSAQPKSHKAFRGVGVMSASQMAMQIALQRAFYRDCLCPGMPLKDQDQMQFNLADSFSIVGTIDLRNASDRLYWFLLETMGSGVPWFDAAWELRTKVLLLPGGDSVECASPVMGEAITFCLLSLFFYSISMAICDLMGWGHDFVRIYGDDIQTPWYDLTIEILKQCGAQVSEDKSYPPSSRFKESCEAHYVSGPRGQLRAARPCYIPSGYLKSDGFVTSATAYKLLVLAKDSWARNEELSKAICDFLERCYHISPLPLVSYRSTDLGRPTLSTDSMETLQLVMKDGVSHEMRSRGALMTLLRSAGTESPSSMKLDKKRRHLFTVRQIRSIKVVDHFKQLEDVIWKRVHAEYSPETYVKMSLKQRSGADHKSWVLANVPDEDISAYIQVLIEHIISVKLG